ncbi:hypothetical protein QYM36_000649 [Artemia franciscana]|uniref:Uncharacterized protein n=1 Tax=Artemia franciscana TaxID=6661 RepID=A0AA88IGC8_ARTSF|nr:hypothetical protein QYM36_000649 [Artemia franciscana]
MVKKLKISILLTLLLAFTSLARPVSRRMDIEEVDSPIHHSALLALRSQHSYSHTERESRKLELETSTIDITKLPGYWIKEKKSHTMSTDRKVLQLKPYNQALVNT